MRVCAHSIPCHRLHRLQPVPARLSPFQPIAAHFSPFQGSCLDPRAYCIARRLCALKHPTSERGWRGDGLEYLFNLFPFSCHIYCGAGRLCPSLCIPSLLSLLSLLSLPLYLATCTACYMYPRSLSILSLPSLQLRYSKLKTGHSESDIKKPGIRFRCGQRRKSGTTSTATPLAKSKCHFCASSSSSSSWLCPLCRHTPIWRTSSRSR